MKQVSCILVGCALGAMFAGMLADRYGRRTILIVCAWLFAASGMGAGMSNDLWIFIVFRVIGGLGVGAAAMIAPMYIAEMAPSHIRGRLVSFYQLAIVLGILLAYFANYLLDDTGINNWRWMFASQAAPSLLFWILLLTVPESPRWLVMKGNIKSAAAVLGRTMDTSQVHESLHVIKNSFQDSNTSIKELLNKRYRTVLVVGILVAVFQQVTGINSILYYAPVIFRETGLDSGSSLLQTIAVGVVNVLSTFIAIGLVDRVGRKNFLLAGTVIMGLSLFAVALCFQYKYFDNYVVLICMLLYVGAFGCTLGAVTWVYISEIFPNKIRGLALSVATLSLWLADFIITYTFPVMVKHLGTSTTMSCYAALCAIAFVYMYYNVKETKGRSLEEIEKIWKAPKPKTIIKALVHEQR
jgi:MFS transporter, SP family, arabinose:H+ symporter